MVAAPTAPYVFISYASADAPRALAVIAALERAGVAVWVDRGGIPGGANYAAAIARAIQTSSALVLLVSAASLGSRNVRQELALAWKHERPYVPLLLDPVAIPTEVEYWLEGAQWVEVLDRPEADWLPQALAALRGLGVAPAAQALPDAALRQVATPAALADPAPGALPRPETRYARSGDLHIAYQVVGDGPLDLVLIPGMATHVEFAWENPDYAHFLRRLAAFSRLILLDKRGTGLSDRVPDLPTLEQRMDDVRAVLDAVGSERAALFGFSEGGSMSALFAATYPERTVALVLLGAFARRLWVPDYPWAPTLEERQSYLDRIEAHWGREPDVSTVIPGRQQDAQLARWVATYQRLAASPGAAQALVRMNMQIDIRHVLPTIHTPALVIHSADDEDVAVGNGRYLAEHIPGARYFELSGIGHYPLGSDQTEAILDAVESFLLAATSAPEVDLILATVLATDLLAQATDDAATGERYRALARREIARFRGREASDDTSPLIAIFDGPARAVRCAQALVRAAGAAGLTARAGLHTGECEVREDAVAGFAVDLAAGVLAEAGPGEVLASGTVKDLVAGSGLQFAERGSAVLAGYPEPWPLFAAQ